MTNSNQKCSRRKKEEVVVTLHHHTFIDSKVFLVHAQPDEYTDNLFCAWKNPDETVTSLEFLPGNYPNTTVYTSKNLEEFARDITWQDWIEAGIKSEELKKLVDAIKPKKTEQEEE